MKYFIYLFVLVWGTQNVLNAQDFSKKYGEVGSDDLNMTFYPKDKQAEAVVLYDIGKSYFASSENSFEIVFERVTRIKIFNEAGFKWASIEIPFYHEGDIYEKVYDIEGYTYNFENGKFNKTKLDISNCPDEKVNAYWSVKKIAMPDVRTGSIIEYKYKIRSQYFFNLRDWEFQHKIPAIYSEYEVDMIPFYEYSWLLQGTTKFDAQTSNVENSLPRQFGSVTFNDMVNKYIMKNVPAFHDEEFISSINDYIIKIDFQLAKINYPNGAIVNIQTTWPDLIQHLIKNNNFGKYVKKSEKQASKILDVKNLTNKTSREKFDIVLNYVKENFRWNMANDKYASKTADEFLKDKFGNCADINLFTVGLLKACGVEAYPIIISTRENGKIKYDYPYSHFFNYVIVGAKIDSHYILSDATEAFLSNDRIPIKCINDKGLIINKEKVEWVSLQCNFPSEMQTNLSIYLADSILDANIATYSTEYDALHFRNKLGNDVHKSIESLIKNEYYINDSSFTTNNQLDIKKPFIFQYSIHNKFELVNNKMYVAPFLDETIKNNPLKQQNRSYPIDMTYPIKRTFISSINIPEGYKVYFIPDGDSIKNDLFEMNYNVFKNDKKVLITFNYYFKNPVYSAGDYSKLKFYFSEIVKKGNEKIVLSKN